MPFKFFGECATCHGSIFFKKVDAFGNCPKCAAVISQRHEIKATPVKQTTPTAPPKTLARPARSPHSLYGVPFCPIVPSSPVKGTRSAVPDYTITRLTSRGNYSEYVAIDTETTGLKSSSDKITELTAIRYKDGAPIEVFHSFTDAGRADAPPIGTIIGAFDVFVGFSDVVAHNLPFHLKFIYKAGSEIFVNKRRYFDTLELAHNMIKESDIEDYTLSSVCSYYGEYSKEQDAGLSDAHEVGLVFAAMISAKKE